MILDWRLTILDWEAQDSVSILRECLNAGLRKERKGEFAKAAACSGYHGQWTIDYGFFYFRFDD